MNIPDIGQKRGRLGKRIKLIFISIMCFMCLAGTVIASSESHDGGGGDHGTKGWVALDTYRVINFSVLAIALFFVLRKPVSQALSSRIEGIRTQLNDLETKKIQAEKELAKYTEKLAELDKEAKKLVDGYIRQGQEAKARIIAEANAAAQKLEAQALRNIDHEFKQARDSIQAEIVEKALLKAESMIKVRINEQDQERLVDEYLQKVVA